MRTLINFQIRKNKKIVACCYYDWYYGVVKPLQRAMDFINYWDNPKYMGMKMNPKHIIIPDELACVAIFQKEKRDFFPWGIGTSQSISPGLHPESYDYMTEKYNMFDFPRDHNMEYGVICVTEKEMNKAIKVIERQIIIDLDYRKVICKNIACYISIANFIIHIQKKRPYLKTHNDLEIPYKKEFVISFNKLQNIIDGYKKKKGIYKCNNGVNIITF